MKKLIVSTICFVALTIFGCAPEPGADMTVTTDSVIPGEGQTVTFKGDSLALAGQQIRVGEPLPGAMLAATDLTSVNLAQPSGRVRILSVVPSLDTPVCEAQTHVLSEKSGGIDKEVELVTVSMDLPFAQKRFAKEAKIANVTFLSDYKTADFGKNHGLLIEPLHLLARAVIVIDKDNVIRHLQVVPEITTLPDMQEAVAAARKLL